jgi:hypothetical protein
MHMPSETKTFTVIREPFFCCEGWIVSTEFVGMGSVGNCGISIGPDGFRFWSCRYWNFWFILTLVSISGALTWCVRSGGLLKRTLEVVLLLGAFGTLFYGYFLTGSIVLAVLTAFISIMMLVGFMLSYVVPKVRGKLSKV